MNSEIWKYPILSLSISITISTMLVKWYFTAWGSAHLVDFAPTCTRTKPSNKPKNYLILIQKQQNDAEKKIYKKLSVLSTKYCISSKNSLYLQSDKPSSSFWYSGIFYSTLIYFRLSLTVTKLASDVFSACFTL